MASTPAPAAPSAPTAPEFDGTVWSLAVLGDVVYAGGEFTTVLAGGRSYRRERLAAFSARTGRVLDWNPSADGKVVALAVARTGRPAVYAAGEFSTVGGRRRDAVARLDAATGAVAAFAHDVHGSASALAVGSGRVFLSGKFTAVDGVPRSNLAAFNHTSGALDRAFRADTDDRVRTLAATRNRLYLGGTFRRVNGTATTRLAAVFPSSGRLVPTFRPWAPAMVRDVAVSSTGVQAALGGPGGRAVSYTPLGEVRWTHLFDGDVHTVTVLGPTTYVGGHYDKACRPPSPLVVKGCFGGHAARIKFAALDAAGNLKAWNPRANGVAGAHALAVLPSLRTVAAGGEFTTIGGARRRHFALLGP